MSVKFDALVRTYRGSQDDLDLFWRKFLVAAELQKWDSDEKKMANLPLFLEGDAFLVWDELSSDEKKDMEVVQRKLMEAFTLSSGQAYSDFVNRTLGIGESIDVYAADLRRLLTAAGMKADGKSPVLIEQFIRGLPSDWARQLRTNGTTGDITKCVVYVRGLSSVEHVSTKSVHVSAAVTAGVTGSSQGRRGQSMMCYNCRKVGHFARDCPQKPQARRGTRPLVCYFCDKPGHRKDECKEREQWLKQSGVRKTGDTNAAAPAENADACAGTPSGRACGLPRIYIDAGNEGTEPLRARAVVDTASTRNLVTAAFVKSLHVPVGPSNVTISAIDGTPLTVLGQVSLSLSRLDKSSIYLPRTTTDLVVVNNLDSVRADVVLGVQLISEVGGVDVQYNGTDLRSVVFGVRDSACSAQQVPSKHLYPHVDVKEDSNGDVTLTTADGSVKWNSEESFWQLSWQWSEEGEPTRPLGSGLGEYPRKKLSEEEEQLFAGEVGSWIEQGWMTPVTEDEAAPMCVLPLIAQVQEHKPTTPVRPCLDYRLLNKRIVSQPGTDAPACNEKIRKWRQAGPADEYELLDVRKAYLQVHIAPELQQYQAVLWDGRVYKMERMGFGLSIAPKFMDIIIKWILRKFDGVDNYIDDILTPKVSSAEVAAELKRYGLDTKPAEDVIEARVLGLQLYSDGDCINWRRRDGCDLTITETPTKRDVFKWCGRVTSHYPVCGWLRPACSYVKRLACVTSLWDEPVQPEVITVCKKLQERLAMEDPVHGVWYANLAARKEVTVYCDASDLAYGAMIQVDGKVLEDRAWLRSAEDKRHINVAELDAAIRGVQLAADWNVDQFTLKTDSKTVHGWLSAVLKNTNRVKATGLYSLLVQRRLGIIEDFVLLSGFKISCEWIPTDRNPADALTRVPRPWTEVGKRLLNGAESELNVSAAVASGLPSLSTSFVSIQQIASEQKKDESICTAVHAVLSGISVSVPEYKKVRNQLTVIDGMLFRSFVDPVDGDMSVPVVPCSLYDEMLSAGHVNTGHANWETVWASLRRRCYIPDLAKMCQQYVRACSVCLAANPSHSHSVPKVRNDTPSQPWDVVHIDTLELGVSRNSKYHCVLVCVDMFTRWVEVVPLPRHDGASVASAFIELCTRWGPPRVVRCDNGSEFVNAVVSSVFQVFGVHVKHGAVRHPQSQGGAERFNRSLLTMIRKTIDQSVDWLSELQILLYYYRTRVHSALGISPMAAMMAWEPRDLSVESTTAEGSLLSWHASLTEKCARIRDHVSDLLAEGDCFVSDVDECPFDVDDDVMLRRPSRHQKCLSEFERGWKVLKIVGPATVIIQRLNRGQRQEKVINVEHLKRDVQAEIVPDGQAPSDVAEDDDAYIRVAMVPDTDDEPEQQPVYQLRDRGLIRKPHRYRDE